MTLKIPRAVVERARTDLEQLPTPPLSPTMSRREAIELLAPPIAAMQRKGYSLGQIAATLSEKHITMTATELAAYLRKAEGNRGSPRRSKRAAERKRGGLQSALPEATGELAEKWSGGTQPAMSEAGSPGGTEPIHAVAESTARATWAGASESPGSAEPPYGENAGGAVQPPGIGTQCGGTIYWVGGDVGGVGKSMLAAATIHLLRGEPVRLVEADPALADVWKAHHKHVASKCIDLWCEEGWALLVDVCRDCAETNLVINTPTGIGRAVHEHGARLDKVLGELRMNLVVLWVIGRRRDSLESLRDFMRTMPHATTHVVRNGYFGDETAFEVYNGSNLRRDVEDRGGRSITLPRLADSVVAQMDLERLCIAEAMTTLPPQSMAELESWWNRVRELLGKVADRPTLLRE